MLKGDDNAKRRLRHIVAQEDFTPPSVVEMLYESCPDSYVDFSITVTDPCCGTGNLLVSCLRHRLEHCKSEEDVIRALGSIYGIELYPDNVLECKKRLLELSCGYLRGVKENAQNIIDRNILCGDFLKQEIISEL